MMLYDSYHFALSFIFCNFRPQPRTSFARPLGRNKNLATSLNKTYNVTRAEKTFNRDRSTGVAKSCVSK